METIATIYAILAIVALIYAVWLFFVPLIICKKMDMIIELLNKRR